MKKTKELYIVEFERETKTFSEFLFASFRRARIGIFTGKEIKAKGKLDFLMSHSIIIILTLI